jgi:hypothetical protein
MSLGGAVFGFSIPAAYAAGSPARERCANSAGDSNSAVSVLGLSGLISIFGFDRPFWCFGPDDGLCRHPAPRFDLIKTPGGCS